MEFATKGFGGIRICRGEVIIYLRGMEAYAKVEQRGEEEGVCVSRAIVFAPRSIESSGRRIV